MLMLLVAGGMLQWIGNLMPLFIFAGVMHPLAWIAIRALDIVEVDLDRASPGRRWLPSSRLLRFPSPPAGGGWCMIRMQGIFLLSGRRRDVSNGPQDIYKEATMGGKFPGEVL